jgi:hypothetical protein
MIAALYVETGGVYFGLPDVDPWDEARDARLYEGPWPVVAHPPCGSWSIMGNCRPATRAAGDGGCFAAALAAVRRFGGVLEHPAYSRAWREFGLARPAERGWTRTLLDDGWTCHVDQSHFGHPACKGTWLYVSGVSQLPAFPSRFAPGRAVTTTTHDNGGGGRGTRSKTPPAFRDALLDMARSAAPAPSVPA